MSIVRRALPALAALALAVPGTALAGSTCSLDDHASQAAHVRPGQDARLVFENDTGRLIQLFADGRPLATLAPWDVDRVLVPGAARSIEARVDGRGIARFSGPFTPDRVYRVLTPTTTDVMVTNPLPIAVLIQAPAQGFRQVLASGGSLVLHEMPVGTVELSALRLEGDLAVDVERVTLGPWSDVTWTVDPPRLGVLQLVNRDHHAVRVLVDGVPVDRVEAGRVDFVELTVGRHRVEVLRLDPRGRPGALVYGATVFVDRYRETEVVVAGYRPDTIHDRPEPYGHRPHDDDDRDGHYDDRDDDDDHERPVSRR